MAVGLNGSADGLTRTTNLPTNSTAMTACGWIRRDDDTDTYAVGLWTTDMAGAAYTGVSFNSDGTTLSAFGTGTGAQEANFAAGGQPAEGAWIFVAFVQNGTTITAYASPEGDDTFYTAAVTGTNYTPAFFGAGNDGLGSFLNGALQHIRVFNSVLSQADLEAEKVATAAVATELFDWRLNDNTDTADISGNGRNPTVGGTLTTQTGPDLGGEAAQEVSGTGAFAIAMSSAFAGTGTSSTEEVQEVSGTGAFAIALSSASAGVGLFPQVVRNLGSTVEWIGPNLSVASDGDGALEVEEPAQEVSGTGAFAIQLAAASAGSGAVTEEEAQEVSGDGSQAIALSVLMSGVGFVQLAVTPYEGGARHVRRSSGFRGMPNMGRR